jgi:hypothetical protein
LNTAIYDPANFAKACKLTQNYQYKKCHQDFMMVPGGTDGKKAKDVRGIKFRADRGNWEAQYKAGRNRVRKNFLNRDATVVWLETAKRLKHKEGVTSHPSSAAEPLLTLAERKELRQYRVNSLVLCELCDQYLTHIQNANNPERPKDQVNPPQRLRVIKEAFGESSAASVQPHEIKDWLISLGRAAGTLNRYKSTLSAVQTYAKERDLVESNPSRDVSHFAVTLGLPRWMSDDEEDNLRAVLETWIADTPEAYRMTRDGKTGIDTHR